MIWTTMKQNVPFYVISTEAQDSKLHSKHPRIHKFILPTYYTKDFYYI